MKPVRALPGTYSLHREVDLSKDQPLLIKLNLAGILLFFAFAWLFGWLAAIIQPEVAHSGLSSGTIEVNLVTILTIVLAFILVLILHEAVHGAFFWIFTQARPLFGLKAAYAYAAAPDWYIPRNTYLVVGLSPLVVISAAGIILLPLVPTDLLLPWLFALATNASGAVGDLYIVGWLLTQPAQTLVQDRGDGMLIFTPADQTPGETSNHSRTQPRPGEQDGD